MKKNKTMSIRSINLEQDINLILEDIGQENDSGVLSQALTKESNKGEAARDTVIDALVAKAAAVSPRSHGPGSNDDSDLAKQFGWETKYDETKPFFEVSEHNQGKGAIALQNLTQEQRMLGELKSDKAKRRTTDVDRLSRILEKKPNGAMVFEWGSIMPPQKEIKGPLGQVAVPYKPSKVFLRICPSCGRANKPELGMDGICVHCNLDIVHGLIAKFPDRFKGVEIEAQS